MVASLRILSVKILKHFEECLSCLVNLLADLSLHYSLVVKANMYLGFLYLLSESAAQEMNLCMKL